MHTHIEICMYGYVWSLLGVLDYPNFRPTHLHPGSHALHQRQRLRRLAVAHNRQKRTSKRGVGGRFWPPIGAVSQTTWIGKRAALYSFIYIYTYIGGFLKHGYPKSPWFLIQISHGHRLEDERGKPHGSELHIWRMSNTC
jgi:hypothetical protein